MRILIVLTYYRPHISGLTIYTERLARALAKRGNEVTVLTSRYDKSLPAEESVAGVRVVRAPVLTRISKGVIMPTFGLLATRLVRQHDALLLHLPQFDAPGLALRGRLLGKPVALTYHCDLQLPPGLFNRLVNGVVLVNNWIAGRLANAVVAYTADYAQHSHFLRPLMDKVVVIPPPVEPPIVDGRAAAEFAARWTAGAGPIIGMCARLASEKGVDILLQALEPVLAEFPDARVLFVGPYKNVLAEAEYARSLEPLLDRYQAQWSFVGSLSQRAIGSFYANCDVTVLPSLNSTESFGLVQIEGMLCGVPSVASDLPGVRQPVLMTGMGRIAPVGDPNGLAHALVEVLRDRQVYFRPPDTIARVFSPAATAARYEQLLLHLEGGPEPMADPTDPYAELLSLAAMAPDR